MTRLVYCPGVCRECDCDDTHACVDDDGVACHWVEPDLCSACAPATTFTITNEVVGYEFDEET